MNRYKVTLNWYGEIHVFYTSSKTAKTAKNNAINRLAKKLGKNRNSVSGYFSGDKDNFSIKEYM